MAGVRLTLFKVRELWQITQLYRLTNTQTLQPFAAGMAVEASLVGNYRKEHLIALKQALVLYDFYMQKVAEIDLKIEQKAKKLETQCDPDKIKRLEKNHVTQG